ncbi:Aldo/keto reductase [Thozetella sp. PMI_491]|nr:Aldo/keto reductase [Thozetella sp. PMI_491]
MAPGLALGTHTWSLSQENGEEHVNAILAVARKHGVKHLDTARIYGNGESEATIGKMSLVPEFTIDTKGASGMFVGSGAGSKILENAKASLEALKLDRVRVYFLHSPDETVSAEDQTSALQKLYEEGKFEKLGLSNFSVDQVRTLYDYAKSKNYVLPSVYQSSYSIAIRRNESELFPTLRELGFSIQAYSPMAAGFLAKTPEYISEGHGSWAPTTLVGQMYRAIYFKPSYMRMLEEFGKLSEKSGVSRVGLAYRWVCYHSTLNGALGDEMIVGAASAEQLEETLVELEKGGLEDWVVQRIDELWDMVKDDAERDNLRALRKLLAASSSSLAIGSILIGNP